MSRVLGGRRLLALGLMAALGLGYLALGSPGLKRRAATPGELTRNGVEVLPELRLEGAEPRVREKLRALRASVLANPFLPEALGVLAMNLDVHGYDPEAAVVYRQAIRLSSTEFRWPYYLAINLWDAGDQEAFEWFRKSRELRGDYLPLLIRHAGALFDAGQLSAAAATLDIVLESDSSVADAYLLLGRTAMASGDPEAARDWLLRGLVSQPENGRLHSALAEAQRRLGDARQAELARLRARRFSGEAALPDPVHAQLLREGVSSRWFLTRGAAYLKQGRAEAALREFDEALEVRPTDAYALDQRGRALQALRRFAEAAAAHAQALVAQPDFLEARLNLSWALFWQNRRSEAMAHADTARRLDPRNTQAYLSLGMYLTAAGQRAGAIRIYGEGLRNAEFDTRIAARLAWLRATSPEEDLRNGSDALALAEAVCEIDGCTAPQTLDLLAAAYAEAGRFGEAVATAEEAVRRAGSAGLNSLADAVRSRLSLYEAGKPYRE